MPPGGLTTAATRSRFSTYECRCKRPRSLGAGSRGKFCHMQSALYCLAVAKRINPNACKNRFCELLRLDAALGSSRGPNPFGRLGTRPLRGAPYPAIQLLQDGVAVLGALLVIANLPELFGGECIQTPRDLFHR